MNVPVLLAWLSGYKYIVFFLLSLVQGPVVMPVAGFLLRLGEVHFWPIYITLMLADLTGDTIWYLVGYHYARPFAKKYGRFFGITERLLNKNEQLFTKHHSKILFFSKISMGLGFALVVLITAGMMRVPFKKYLILNALGQLIWTAALLAVGYFFGNLYVVINKGLKDVALGAFICLVLVAVFGFGSYVRQRTMSTKV